MYRAAPIRLSGQSRSDCGKYLPTDIFMYHAFPFIYSVYIYHHLQLTIPQLAEHLTVEIVIRHQSVLGSIPSRET